MSALLLLATMAGGPVQTAEASTFRPITYDELVETSVAVIQVRVVDTSAAWTPEPHSYIATTAQLEVVQSLSGDFQPGESLFVREAGGEVDGYAIQVPGFPQFEVGSEVVVFLKIWEDGSSDYRINHYGQGIYEVYTDDEGVQRVRASLLQGDHPDADERILTVVPNDTSIVNLAKTLK